ncbi:hypothetical protein VPNG_00983 [Cytospora leucostoma]|uniref:Ketoreductase (KR) domain-containing protein n=1 Tax=Cytospora leucostoma TaxID=1230097 RepID=A0A423XMG3_9PEZI|nr:hypothetical protein VPNG_00983 [Cytospora leucostoma]
MASSKGTILVTGANGGLGSAIAQQIASRPEFAAYHGLYTVRDAMSETATALDSALRRSVLHSYDILPLDLAQLDRVRETARSINDRVFAGEIPPIRALILNAGLQNYGRQVWTTDGLDMTFSANYLGHWLLTLLLLKSIDKASGRIVVVGSQVHDPYDKRNDLGKNFAEERYKTVVTDEAKLEAIARGTWSTPEEDPSWRSSSRRYGASKLFLIMFMHELQRRVDRDPELSNICVLGTDPGTMSTPFIRYAPWIIRVLIFRIIFPIILFLKPDGPVRTTDQSAIYTLQAAFDSSFGEFPKDLYFNGTEPRETSAESRDAQKRDLVWKTSVRLAQLKEGETILGDWQ